MSARISLIVGLGNPGPKYEATRHNAGFWYVEHLARDAGSRFKLEAKFHGEVCKISLAQRDVWLLKPHTYMNASGQAVRAVAQFYRIDSADVLVAHDELDLPPGTLRVKRGGGAAGHNGIRDISEKLGNPDYLRLRIGIGRPATRAEGINYVLNAPPKAERAAIDAAIGEAAIYTPALLDGDLQKAMNHLHSLAPASPTE